MYCQYESQRGNSQFFFFYAFPCIRLVHEVLHYAFTSIVYTGFLVRVLFKSTFVWRFGHASLCDMLVGATYVCIQQRLHCIMLLLIY